jgi:hypothetical protein
MLESPRRKREAGTSALRFYEFLSPCAQINSVVLESTNRMANGKLDLQF